MRGSSPSPSFPKPKSPLFPKYNLLTLSRSRDELARPILAALESARPTSRVPGLALWAAFWNMFHYFLAATSCPAVFVLARTLGTINPVRRAWIYGH